MAQFAQLEVASREKILDAAEDLFARRGFAGIGMREVAEIAGLGKSSLFHHFRSKAELYAAVVGRILDHLDEQLTAALAAGGNPLVRFDRWLDTLIDNFAQRPTYARLLLRSLFEDDELTGAGAEEQHVDRTIKHIFGAIGNLLREGMENGVFRLASIPHTLQSIAGLTVYHFASGEFGDELLGQPVFTAAEVRRRKQEVKALLHHGLTAGTRKEGKLLKEPPR
ncbi:MAG TPA: TetR/AcrR family transcriptional regulator [Candidatus Margulisiibacteriota bacterium]|nr:TetR/AcrR family transcriptional regulator [Candidatus Margulisiibacteriota bacterium]